VNTIAKKKESRGKPFLGGGTVRNDSRWAKEGKAKRESSLYLGDAFW